MFGLWTLICHILQVLFLNKYRWILGIFWIFSTGNYFFLGKHPQLDWFSHFKIKKKKIQKLYEIKIMEQSLTI